MKIHIQVTRTAARRTWLLYKTTDEVAGGARLPVIPVVPTGKSNTWGQYGRVRCFPSKG